MDTPTPPDPRNIADCGSPDCTPVTHWQRVAMRAIAALATPDPSIPERPDMEYEALRRSDGQTVPRLTKKRSDAHWLGSIPERPAEPQHEGPHFVGEFDDHPVSRTCPACAALQSTPESRDE